jgi:predicted transcriptional regulator
MPKTTRRQLTPQELAIMKIVWRLNKATVRDVYETMRETRPVAYTTMMTMMKILEEKGYLKKTLVDRTHVYKPVKPRQQVMGAMVRDFVDRVFDGAPSALLLHLAKSNTLTEEQRRAIKQLIGETEEE